MNQESIMSAGSKSITEEFNSKYATICNCQHIILRLSGLSIPHLWSVMLLFIIFSAGILPRIKAQPHEYQARITGSHLLPDIPSASGLIRLNDTYFVVGDDSPFLFRLDEDLKLINTIPIYKSGKLEGQRIPKKHKPDFESIALAPWGKDSDLLVFGSGAGSKEREIMIRIDFDEDTEEIKTYSLKKFYKYLADKSCDQGKINIEGAAYWKKNLILLNRADNTLFMVDFKDFRDFLKKKDRDDPDVKAIYYELPVMNGITARFSGACLLPDEDMLVFTASVENTPDWINDGEILGSYIGIIDLKQTEYTTPVCVMIQKDEDVFPGKVESLIVTKKNERSIRLIGVTDNDEGSSRWVELSFEPASAP